MDDDDIELTIKLADVDCLEFDEGQDWHMTSRPGFMVMLGSHAFTTVDLPVAIPLRVRAACHVLREVGSFTPQEAAVLKACIEVAG